VGCSRAALACCALSAAAVGSRDRRLDLPLRILCIEQSGGPVLRFHAVDHRRWAPALSCLTGSVALVVAAVAGWGLASADCNHVYIRHRRRADLRGPERRR